MRLLPAATLLAVTIFTASAGSAQQASAHVAHTPDVDLAYETLGTRHQQPPLIAVNGGPGLTHAYMVQNNLWQRASTQRQVVFYDQRGNGQSRILTPNAPQTMDAQVADLDAIRAALGADKVDLLGDSFGGFVVLAYTLAHPEHVHRLIVSDGLPGYAAIVHPMPDIFPDLEEQTAAQLKALGGKGRAAEDLDFRAHIRKCFYSPELATRYLDGMKDLGLNAAVGEQVSTASQSLDLTSKLGQVKVPTLILTGRFDVNVAPLTAWRMKEAIPNAQFHVFEHSGHLPSYEEPDAYLATLNSFLTSQP